MKKKLAEVSPATARKALKTLWSKVAVYSCADGTLRMEPVWRRKYARPGLLTRMHAARLVEIVLRLPRKSINWCKRASSSSAEQLPSRAGLRSMGGALMDKYGRAEFERYAAQLGCKDFERNEFDGYSNSNGIPPEHRTEVLEALCHDQRLPSCDAYLRRGLRCSVCPAVIEAPTASSERPQEWLDLARRDLASSAEHDVAARSFPICKDHTASDWNQPELEDDACVLCRLFYLEAQEGLLEQWQQQAKRAEDALAEVKRPLDEQMARLNATVTWLNAENDKLRAVAPSSEPDVIERCAKVCEEQIERDEGRGRLQARSILTRCAEKIRSLKCP